MDSFLVTDDENTTYGLEEVMAILPDTLIIGRQASFTEFFTAPTPYDSMLGEGNIYPKHEKRMYRAYRLFKRDIVELLQKYGVPEEEYLQWPMNTES